MYRISHMLVLLSCLVWARAQPEIRFEEVYSINPLSHNSVTCIHQDRLGFLWLGTFNGLNKYDGYSFKIYKFNDIEGSQAGINRILSIMEDQQGKLWVQTYDGKYQYFNPATEKTITFPPAGKSPEQTRCNHFFLSETGDVCLSTDRSGVFFIRSEDMGDELQIYHLLNVPGKDRILSSNNVLFVTRDMNGYFWLGTDRGLHRIHEGEIGKDQPRVESFFTEEGGNDRKASFSDYEVLGSTLWFVGKEKGLIRYDPSTGRFDSFGTGSGNGKESPAEVTSLTSDGSRLWAGTSLGQLLAYDPENELLSEFNITHPGAGKVIRQIYCDRFEQVWLLTDEFGITRFDPAAEKFCHYTLTPERLHGLTDDERIRIHEDSRNQFWVGGQNLGIQLYDREKDLFIAFKNDPSDPSSLQSSIVECIMEDREKNLWIGTNWFGKGLSRMITIDPAFDYIVPVPRPETRLQNVVRSIYVDSKGYTWAGTKSGQIYIYDPDLNPVHILEEDPGVNYSGYNVYSIVEDRNGIIWLCTKGAGIFFSEQPVQEVSPHYERMTFGTIQHDPATENSLNNNNVYDLALDDLGRVWVATYGGGLNLIETDGNGRHIFTQFTTGNSNLTSDKLRDLHIDRNGRLWLASTLGINYIDIYKESKNQMAIGNILSGSPGSGTLSYNDIVMIMEDKNGHLWLGTAGGGVDVIPDPSGDRFGFNHFSEKDGLKDDYILSLTEDIYGFIWIGTASGLSRYNPVSGDITNYDKKIGLPEVSFSERTSTSSPSGRVLFGTVNGFYAISPDRITTEDLNPTICLTGLQLNNVEIAPGAKGSPLDRSISYMQELRLKSHQSNFAISFSMLSFKSPESNHYSYMLEGFDEGWNYIGTQNKATFTNVPPGSYTFRVKGLNSDLSEHGTEASLQVVILPPVWRTKPAIILYVLVFFLLLYFSYRIARRFVRLKNNLKVEKRVAESKLRFFTNISHEIRTPLTLILGPVDNLISQKGLRADVRQQLVMVHRNTKRLLRMVNQLLDFRKVQSEQMQLRIQEISLIPFLQQIYESFEMLARQKQIHFRLIFDRADEDLKIWGDIQKLDSVIFNLLSNAFKFTKENGNISIIVSREFEPESSVRILVRDTGIGIDRDKLDLVFNRFFVSHTEGDNLFQGTGIGLSLCQEYVRLHKGEIQVESTKGKGTDFILRLLTGNAHFEDDVIVKEREAYSYTPKVLPEESPVPQLHMPAGKRVDGEKRQHILVVEDDLEMCGYLQGMLEPVYQVHISKDGIDGWNKALQLTPDLIITDIMMPGMDGIELTEKIKDEFKTCHIPVIMLSSRSEVESQVEGLQTGAEAYISKPFHTELLISQVQSLLSQRKRIREIFESRIELKPDEVRVAPKDKEFIKKVIRIIEENLSDPEFNVEKLAAKTYISRTLFYKKIKGITGYQPVELIRMMRLKKAAKYIETGEFTVSEVAYMVGYNDIRYFSTSFKKQYGVSPSRYQFSQT
ncbi:MAG TPA: hybrid sensor histidine kinase/response regulator [Bacteroides sp.]|nr:hybrid sensor histidine kinase/response regulator [Bacteroides sp.]